MISKKETPSKFRKSFSGKEGRTFSKEGKSFSRDGKSFSKEGKSFSRDGKSFSKDGKSFSRDGKSFSRDGKSFSKDGRSFSRDGKSFSKEERAFSKERRVGRRDFPKGNGMGPLVKKVEDDGTVRLNKFLANTGLCSRRDADEYIKAGLVTVNGKVVTQMGVRVTYEDDVRFNGERMRGEKKVYIIMNKPKDFVTTVSDPHAEKCVMDLISKTLCPERVFPVGRLDKSTTGVLLFTNDGELAEKLTHPSYQKKKIYQVTLDRNFKSSDMTKLSNGVELEDGMAYADEIAYVGDAKDVVGIEIHSGKNRIVRRMFEHLDYKVKKLDRVYFAGLTKKNLSRGQWRFLSDEEVLMLKMNMYE
ncbi:MAG: pseudouridine synthase [Candidatus Coprenecus sp.]